MFFSQEKKGELMNSPYIIAKLSMNHIAQVCVQIKLSVIGSHQMSNEIILFRWIILFTNI